MEPETHEVNLYQQGSTSIFNCEICGYKAAFIRGFGMVKLHSGAPGVRHEYSAQMTIGVVLMADEQESDPFAEWAEGADFSPLDDYGPSQA